MQLIGLYWFRLNSVDRAATKYSSECLFGDNVEHI